MTDTTSKLTDEQLKAYLLRLGLQEAPLLSLESLNKLVFAHQCNIPFETTAVYHCETPPSLRLEDVFDKAITQKRGGYCFELGHLFGALLATLGFDTRPVCGRIHVEGAGRRPILHRGTLVTLEGSSYYTDIGFGGPIAGGALEFAELGAQHVLSSVFEMRRLDECWWAIDALKNNKDGTVKNAETIMEVCTVYLEEQDFDALNLACSQPGGRFWENCILNRRISEGNYSIINKTLTINTPAGKQIVDLPNLESWVQAVEEYFGFNPLSTPHTKIEQLFN